MADFSYLELDISKLLIDPLVRSYVAPHIEDWMFTKNVTKAITGILFKPEYVGRNPDINIMLVDIRNTFRNKLTAEEFSQIQTMFQEYHPIPEDDTAHVMSIMSTFIQDRLRLMGANCLSKGQTALCDQYNIKAANFSLSVDDFVDARNPEMVRYLQAQDLPPGGKVIKSSLSYINRALVYGGWKLGDCVMVVAGPKTGKSTWLAQEAVNFAEQGILVAHLFFGDMSKFDGLVKCTSCFYDELYGNVLNDPIKYTMQPGMQRILGNIRFASFPAATVTISEVTSKLKSLKKNFPFNVFILDYDANIIPPDDSMYTSGGMLYSAVKGFAQSEGAVGLIASQPKPEWWNKEILDGTSANESSRKQAVIDAMITFGRNPKCSRIGTSLAPFIRRGQSNISSKVRFDYGRSRIKEISRDEYASILRDYKDMEEDNGEGSSFLDIPEGAFAA